MPPRDLPDQTLVLPGARNRKPSSKVRETAGAPSDPTSQGDGNNGTHKSAGKKRAASMSNTDSGSDKRARTTGSHSPIEVDGPDDMNLTGSSSANHKSTGDPTAVDADGFLADIDVASISGAKKPKVDGNKDLDHFFGEKFQFKKPDSKYHTRRTCLKCPGGKKSIVAESTTLRRHLEAEHYQAYKKWAKGANFTSALPGDRKALKLATTEALQPQATLDSHLKEIPPKERVIPYSHEVFREAAIEWLVATDQPVDALDHPKFREMIDIAARAKDGVRIPGRKSTREEIINLFKRRMEHLKEKLNGPTVTGDIHLTDDAWTASNGDGYLAASSHFIEEVSPGVWESREALIGFVRLNNAHNGKRLGQALYKIVARLGIQKRIGYMTTDSAPNNGTAAVEFAAQLLMRDNVVWDPAERHLPCMAHIINLATQALISTYSKSPHFDPKKPEAHLPDTSATLRDEIGLIRAIAVKERSSPKRKEIFKGLQVSVRRTGNSDVNVSVTVGKQLILDMKVRWSSTYHMLLRALELRPYVDAFVVDISYDAINAEERAKIRELQLTPEEWRRVDKFAGLLAHAEKAQQAFSSGTIPSLHRAIPALEALHSAWSKRAKLTANANFAPALEKAADKIDEYYQKTSRSTVQVLAMVLDPEQKGQYFKKNWGDTLAQEARETAKTIFEERWRKLNAEAEKTQPAARKSSKFGQLLREASPEFDDNDTSSEVHRDPAQPWLDEFEEYYDSRPEILPENDSMVSWWGRCLGRFPTWRSLARDRLSIPASSVSSERAFSSGGITISKRRNRLKGDIVEALQVLKSLIRGKDMFRAPPVSTIEEDDDTLEEDDDAEGWDCFIDDDPDNYELDTTID